MLGSATAELC